MRPRDEKALELLAGVLRQPELDRRRRRRPRGRHLLSSWRAAGRRRATSRTRSRRCAGRWRRCPGHAESSELLERVYYDARRFQELDRFYRERVRTAATEAERIDFLYKRAQLSEGELEDVAEAQRVYNEISLLEPAGGPASEKLVELYLHGQEYAKLAELRERQLGAIADPQQRARTMLELAALYRDRLGDRDQAAVYLHAVLEIEPENQMALGAYAEHFREKGDWAALADLLEFSFERARLAGIGAEELLPRLEEIATVSEKQLGDPERAIAAWQRAEEIAPTLQPGARGAAAPAAQGQELGPAGRAAGTRGRRAAGSGAARRDPAPRRPDLPREAGQGRARDRDLQGHPAGPIRPTRCRCARSSRPTSARATSSAWPTLLREQIDRAGTKQERVGLLRRVLVICDERTGDLAQGQWAATEILQAVPGDRDTLTRLERILERAGQARRAGADARSAHQARREPGREAGDPAPHRRHHARPAAGSARRRRSAWKRSSGWIRTTARRSARWSRSTRA